MSRVARSVSMTALSVISSCSEGAGNPVRSSTSATVATQAGLADLADRQVDAHERGVPTRGEPADPLPARLFEQAQAERHDQAGVLGKGDELVRPEHPEARMAPPGQRLDAD